MPRLWYSVGNRAHNDTASRMTLPGQGAAQRKLTENVDRVCELIAQAVPMSQIAKEFGVSRRSLFNWCKLPEVREKVEAAKAESAESWVEKAQRYLDEAKGDSNSEVGLVKLRVDFCMRMAEIRNRAEWGDKPQGLNVNVNIGQLHLDALRKVGRMSLEADNVTALPAVDAEVEEED